MMPNLDVLFSSAKDAEDFAEKYFTYLSEIMRTMDTRSVGQMIRQILEARDNGKNIFFIGNGGSAATASHFANDISIGTRTAKKPFKALSLTDNNAILTAIGNDDGYDNIFVKQLQVHANEGDTLVAISASGNSPNILDAVEYARKKNLFVIGLTGFDGGRLKALSNLNIHVKTPNGEYGPVEDIHMVIDHLIGSYLCRLIRQSE